MSKYAPLADFLRGQQAPEVPLTFLEIERVLGAKLPPSSKYPAWWSNNPSNNVMTETWLKAGFRTERVDIPGQKLVFKRVEPEPSKQAISSDEADADPSGIRNARRHRIFGCMRGSLTITPGADLTQPADTSWGAGT